MGQYTMGCSGVRPHSDFAHKASILMLSFDCKAGACLSERFFIIINIRHVTNKAQEHESRK